MNLRSIAIIRPAFALLAVVALAGTVLAQNPKLQLDSLQRLEAKAAKTVDVTIDRELMGLAVKMIAGEADGDAKKIQEVVAGIKEIYVRGYEFENEGEYDKADIDVIRTQLSGNGWSRLTSVRSRKSGDNAEIYVMHGGGKVLGLAILVSEPKEVTVVNIVGEIDPERLSELDGEFGVPRVELKRDDKPQS